MKQGIVSIRNEDGTQWLCLDEMWSSVRSAAWPFNYSHFLKLQGEAPTSTRENSPDNGFFGLMNLRFHELNEEQIKEQIKKAEKIYADWAAEEDWADNFNSGDDLVDQVAWKDHDGREY